jgi:hypothetical protein
MTVEGNAEVSALLERSGFRGYLGENGDFYYVRAMFPPIIYLSEPDGSVWWKDGGKATEPLADYLADVVRLRPPVDLDHPQTAAWKA